MRTPSRSKITAAIDGKSLFSSLRVSYLARLAGGRLMPTSIATAEARKLVTQTIPTMDPPFMTPTFSFMAAEEGNK